MNPISITVGDNAILVLSALYKNHGDSGKIKSREDYCVCHDANLVHFRLKYKKYCYILKFRIDR